jgi:hypothetical protein
MKQLLSLALVLACVLAGRDARAGTPVPVPDGVANCQWLKIGVSARMIDLQPDNAGLGARHSTKAVCYLQLVYTPPDPNNPGDTPHGTYSGPLLCQKDAATWVMSGPDDSLNAKVLPDGNATAIDKYLTFMNAGGDVIQGFGSHLLHITVDKTGAFHSATFQTLAAELLDSSTFFVTDLSVMGSYVAKGSSVPAAKVPPEAVALVTPSTCTP